MKISVTQDHIDNGIPTSCGKCPIALAIREQYPKCDSVRVMELDIAVYANHERLVYIVPDKASNFITAFDSGDPVEPFTFVIQRRNETVGLL